MSTSIDFGLMLQPFPTDFPGSELADYNRGLIKRLDRGFSTLWIEDHLQWEGKPVHECLTSLAFFAGEFPQYRIGSLVMSQGYRNPALLAKMAANLQLLTGGRFILGLGAGWKADEYQAYGYPFPGLGIRMEELEEAIHIIKSMWSESPATFIGKHYQIREAYCQPQPSPAIPLLIGGGGEQKTLSLVARYADMWNFNSCPPEEYARKVGILKEHCARIERDPGEIKLTYLSTASVSKKPDQVVRSSQKHYVAGSPDKVIRELEEFQRIGVSHFIFRFLDPESLERFVELVVPHFV